MPNHKLKVPPHGGAKHARRSRRDKAAAAAAAVMPLAQAAAAAARPQPEGQEGEAAAAAGAAAAAANLQGNGVQNNVAYASSSAAGPTDQVDPDSEIRDDELEEPSEVRRKFMHSFKWQAELGFPHLKNAKPLFTHTQRGRWS